MDKAFHVYNKGGFTITSVHCDQEFKHIMDKISDDLNVEMNYTTTGEHVPEAERNNRTLKERMHSTVHHRLPFNAMPKEMLGALVVLACQQLNFFPAKTGVSSYKNSPFAIMTGKNLDYNQFKVPFGQSVQASDEPLPYNIMEPRTLDCIVLGPSENIQTGWKLLNLATGKVITRTRVTVVPITNAAIARVDSLAAKQGIRSLSRSPADSNWILSKRTLKERRTRTRTIPTMTTQRTVITKI
jgi:hypothetical protein